MRAIILRGKKDGDVERWYQLREIEEQWYSDGDNFQVPFKYLPSVEEVRPDGSAYLSVIILLLLLCILIISL